MNTNPILLKDFIKFIIRPKFSNNFKDISKLQKLFNIIRLLSWVLILNIIVSIVLEIALGSLNATDSNIIIGLLQKAPLFFIVYGVFVAPLIEELIFRLSLKFKPIYLSISFFIFTLEFSVDILRRFTNSEMVLIILVLIVSLILSLLIYFLTNIKNIKIRISNLYEKHFRIIFYLSVIVFGYLHLTNYTNLTKIWILIPFLTLPQLSAGALLGFIRSKYGFSWGVLTHMANNSTIFPVSLIYAGSQIIKVLSIVSFLFIGLILIIFALTTFIFDLINIFLNVDIYQKIRSEFNNEK